MHLITRTKIWHRFAGRDDSSTVFDRFMGRGDRCDECNVHSSRSSVAQTERTHPPTSPSPNSPRCFRKQLNKVIWIILLILLIITCFIAFHLGDRDHCRGRVDGFGCYNRGPAGLQESAGTETSEIFREWLCPVPVAPIAWHEIQPLRLHRSQIYQFASQPTNPFMLSLNEWESAFAAATSSSSLKESNPTFFFLWTTPWSGWRLRHYAFLDSLLVQNPGASVFFVTTFDDNIQGATADVKEQQQDKQENAGNEDDSREFATRRYTRSLENPSNIAMDYFDPSDAYDGHVMLDVELEDEYVVSTKLLHDGTLIQSSQKHPLSRYVEMGYNVHGIHVPLSDFQFTGWWTNNVTKEWLLHVTTAKIQGKYTYTHLTDYMRFFMIHKFGCVYTDTDALFLRPIPSGNFIGMDYSTDTATWFVDPERHLYTAPGLASFQAGLSWMTKLMENTFCLETYDETCFNCVGPKAMNIYIRQHYLPLKGNQNLRSIILTKVTGQNDAIRSPVFIFIPSAFYPVPYDFATEKFYRNTSTSRNYFESLRRRSFALHLFGHTTNHARIQVRSVLSLAMEATLLQRHTGIGMKYGVDASLGRKPLEEGKRKYGSERAIRGHDDNDPKFILSHRRASSQCGLGVMSTTTASNSNEGIPTFVIVGQLAVFRGPLSLFVRGCESLLATLLNGPVSLRVSVSIGSLSTSLVSPTSSFNAFEKSLEINGLASVADANKVLASLQYYVSDISSEEEDTLRIVLTYRSSSSSEALDDPNVFLEASVRLLIFHRLVTIATHTQSRLFPFIANMYDSVQTWFPGTFVVVSDGSSLSDVKRDSEITNVEQSALDTLMNNRTNLIVLPLSSISGVSFARTDMVTRITTPYIYIVDDYSVLKSSSHLDVLLKILSEAGDFDIASGAIPTDANSRGILNISLSAGDDMNGEKKESMAFSQGDYGAHHGCLHVDFTPNNFMVRRKVLEHVWLSDSFVGKPKEVEPLEFFVRAKKAGLKILSCDNIEIFHDQ